MVTGNAFQSTTNKNSFVELKQSKKQVDELKEYTYNSKGKLSFWSQRIMSFGIALDTCGNYKQSWQMS